MIARAFRRCINRGLMPGLVLSAFALSAPAWAKDPVLSGVRIGLHPGKTRVVIDLSDDVPVRYFTLPDPYRVVIDLPEVQIEKAGQIRKSGGVISDLRHGLFEPGIHRFVFDLTAPVRAGKPFILPPRRAGRAFRLVLDLSPVERAGFLAQSKELMAAYRRTRLAGRASRPDVQSTPPPGLIEPARPAGKRVITVDAGHGGVDPGAISVDGTYEKNITLTAARDLRDALEATGKFRVVMTRDRDVFLRLRQRVAVARQNGASLFVSVHADSLENRRHRGSSVYTLSETASDKEAARLARQENKADTIAGLDLTAENSVVQSILIDLAQRETMNLSARFAADLVAELDPVVKLQRRHHRFAGFAVLKAPDVPSVLLEMGYLSNKADLKLLQTPSHRKKLAAAVARAAERYFAENDRLTRS